MGIGMRGIGSEVVFRSLIQTQRRFERAFFWTENFVFSCALLALAIPLTGCGGSGFKVAPVAGTVTLDGKPVGGLIVNFQPASVKGTTEPGPGSYAWTDKNGQFSMALISDKDYPGAVVGKHRVTLSSPLPDQSPTDDRIPRSSKPLLPPEHEGKSFEFEVPADGTDKANFALTSGASRTRK